MQTILRFPDRDRKAEFQGTNANGSMYFVHGIGLVCVQNIERIDNVSNQTTRKRHTERRNEGQEGQERQEDQKVQEE